jgi:hypothetical protein
MQCGLKKSASPDRHWVDEMIFVTAVEIAYMLVHMYFGVRNLARWVFVSGFVDFGVRYDVSYQNVFFLLY